jgi:hypothetical protein
MTGGAHRGPVAQGRQRRTIRMMQALLVVIAAALLMFAGYAWGRSTGFDQGRRSGEVGAPSRPSAAQVVVLGVLGLGALAGAFLLGGPGGARMPTPARLEELTGRAEGSAAKRASADKPAASIEAMEPTGASSGRAEGPATRSRRPG